MAAVAGLLAACGDDIPRVDVAQARANAIKVGGDTLTRRQFLDRFCSGGKTHESCVFVRTEETAAMARKPLPKTW